MKDCENAQAWLKQLDDANYESCWHIAAEYFKAGVSLDEWKGKAKSARDSVGEIQSRELSKSQETEDVVGPAGAYFICEYKSVFSKVGDIGERLTLLQEEDGRWRVVGYYLI